MNADQSKLRSNCPDCRHPSPHADPKPSSKKKSRKKKSSDATSQSRYQQPCDLGFAPYAAFNLTPQTRLAPRLFASSDPAAVCHYPVPFGYSLEHVPVPFYSTLIQPGAAAPSAASTVRINRTTETKVPAIFQTYKPGNCDTEQQDYMSLPPVNCDLSSKKSQDEETTYKRRFSDPGLAQISSDESGSRSSESSKNSSLQDLHIPYAYGLIEQVNELREYNSNLMKELHETKLELESLKMLSASWKPYSENLQPGKLSDSIVEVREAIKVNEEAMLTKMTNLFERNASQCNEAHRQLEEKFSQKLNDRLTKVEDQLQKLADAIQKEEEEQKQQKQELEEKAKESAASEQSIQAIQQQLVDSEREKLTLRKELQEAIDSRERAEENTLKLERLVSVLRKKVNGVSLEVDGGGVAEDKHIRPLSASFEQNPFIIANNKQGHRGQQPGKSNSGRRSDDGSGSVASTDRCPPVAPTTTTTIAPQVTISGPVTDL